MIKVLAFDTFGTVTDWHTGVGDAMAGIFPEVDAHALTRDWRRAYSPALRDVEAGRRPWALLDDLHRESLTVLLHDRGVTPTDGQLDAAVHAWHVIPGWPDVSAALRRLRSRYIVGTLSNGNVALLVEMAKHSDLAWDFIGGADIWGHYKPAADTYLGITRILDVAPDEVLMVATHSWDLDAARSYGLQTAYVERPHEWGPERKEEARDPANLFHVTDLGELADLLGC
ncbi:haloacid dehalogenase type II [Williamsia sterculiae]|nr:haloacid dehalogenase type II [Williamsia sterculiae]